MAVIDLNFQSFSAAARMGTEFGYSCKPLKINMSASRLFENRLNLDLMSLYKFAGSWRASFQENAHLAAFSKPPLQIAEATNQNYLDLFDIQRDTSGY